MGIRGPESTTDWEAIEKHYRLNQMTIDVIARKYGVTKGLISRKAKKENWVRDVGEQYRAEVNNSLLRKKKSKKPLTKEEFDIAVQSAVTVVREHKKILGKTRKIASDLVSRLEENINSLDDGVILEDHVKMFKMLNEAASKWIELDRKSFNLDAQNSEGSDMKLVEERINALMESSNAN